MCERIVNILNFVVFVVSDELLNFATEIQRQPYTIYKRIGSDLSPGEERLVLTFTMETEIPVPVPPSFIRMTVRKLGIKIKGKPKKTWR